MELKELDIKGQKLSAFNKKGIYTIEDLANYLPRKYWDFRNPIQAKDLVDGEYQSIIGCVYEVTSKNKGLVNVKLKDSNNKAFSVSFFNQPFRAKTIKVGVKYIICGTFKLLKDYNNYPTATNPIVFSDDIKRFSKIYPVYSKIEKTSEAFLQDKINSALTIIDKEDYLEPILLKKYNLLTFHNAKRLIHQPNTIEDVRKAQKRLLFDDLFQFNFKLMEDSISSNNRTNIKVKTFNKSKELMENLPFELTEGQRFVLRTLSKSMIDGNKINTLVQGDVGCGKTLVAILLLTIIAENGYQGCLVAPTEILASQHFNEVQSRMEPLGFKVGYLSGRLKKSEQNKILKELKTGGIDIIVGTHAIMSDKVIFNNLGMSIIDEEHRFGVEQRDVLKKDGVHTVSMSATPIPRTIALSMFGPSIDVITIKSAPKGRQPIDTNIIPINDSKIAYKKMLDELKKGRQAYIICPLIKESKSDDDKMKGIANVEDTYHKANNFFSKYGFTVGFVTGDTGENKNIDTNQILTDFKDKKIDVLVATTIVEVGVNVPNATVITILNADRFGFAQLHQLRGRVGRGAYKSYCYLATDNVDKFEIFSETNDGFEISKADLLLRGSGTFLGTQQSGSNKYLMLLLANEKLNENIRADISDIFKDNARLKRYRALKNKKLEV